MFRCKLWKNADATSDILNQRPIISSLHLEALWLFTQSQRTKLVLLRWNDGSRPEQLRVQRVGKGILCSLEAGCVGPRPNTAQDSM